MCVLLSLLFWGLFFFQAEDGIRDAQESRGLGDVYKRQHMQGGNIHVTTVQLSVTPFSVLTYSGDVIR